MTIGKKDKAVINSFTDRKPNHAGHKLDTDGVTLDGLWMGGRKLAAWQGEYIVFKDSGGVIGQQVQNAVRKSTPANWLHPSERRGKHRAR